MKILLVDDERDFLNLMGQRIESWGYEVISASSATEAMKAFTEQRPDAIILDYVMSDTNGVELLMKIRALDMKVPAIMLTAKPDPDSMEDSEKLNILAFIPKLSSLADTQTNLRTALNMALKGKDAKNG